MTEATLREQMYRRWKKGEDYFVLAKEMGVTRERMRIILKKMDADVPLVDQIEAQAAEIERLRGDVAKAVEERDEALNQLDSARNNVDVLEKRVAKLTGAKP